MNPGTVLDDQRIDDIRARVMADVDADVRRRTRRTRFVAGAAAAGVVVVALGSGLAVMSTEGGPSNDVSTAAEPAPVPGDFSGSTDGGAVEVAPAPEQGQKDLTAPQVQEADRSVVTTGWVELTVDDPSASASGFGAWVERAGGRIDQRSDQDGSAQLTVRVPADVVTAAIDQLRATGEVDATSITDVDVTSQVVDLDARILALQSSVDRLLAILGSATTTGEVVEAEATLTQRQAELDGLVAQRAALGDQVDLSTIDVSFTATEAAASVEADGFLGGLRTGWNSVVETVNGVVTAAGVVVPWLAIVLVLGTAAWGLARRRRRAD